jgi:RNA recognition motif-containing protein
MMASNIDQVLESNRRARRLGLTNVPFEFNISLKDLKDFFNRKMLDFSLNEPGNQQPVVRVSQQESRPEICIIEFASQEEAAKAAQLDGLKLLGRSLKVGRPEELAGTGALGQMLGVNTQAMSVHDNIETSAKAAAAATAAFQVIQGNAPEIDIKNTAQPLRSKVLKICDFLNEDEVRRLPETEFREIEADMRQEFGSVGQINFCRIVKPHQAKLGAETGSVFIEFAAPESVQAAISKMKGKKYDNHEIRLIEIPEDVFNKELRPS